MTEINAGAWRIQCDIQATLNAYMISDAGPERCACAYCRNFVAARATVYPPAARELYQQFGIIPDREIEVYEMGRELSGLIYYGGWHYLIGTVLVDSGDMQIAPDFNVCFRAGKVTSNVAFPDHPIVRLEFFTHIPWVLEEPYPHS